jgi:hypothetical protein
MTATLSTSGPLTCGGGGGYTMNPNATYSYIPDADNFISSWVGTADDGYYDLSLSGFDFKFYGTSVTSVRISTNGYITFGASGSSLSNVSIPNVSQPNAIIAPFWDDLNATGLTSPPGVWWRFYGAAPNRYLVIEWYQVPRYGYPSSTYSFEIVLYESSDRIKFQYLDVDSGTPYDFGASATVGIENFTGNSGVQFSYNTASLSNGKAIEFTPRLSKIVDFDGDGKTDVAVYHSASGLWFIKRSSDAVSYSVGYGGSGYVPVPSDFDGDGKTDTAVYHSASGLWFIKRSSDAASYSVGYGGSGYVPAPGDYDGDGKTDVAVYHAATGLWFIKKSSDGTSYSVGYGGTGYDPVFGDFDGDGKIDTAVYHSGSGLWFIKRSSDAVSYSVGYGGSGYVPVPGDYDGDGKTDVAVYHAATGLWFVKPSTGAGDWYIGYGGTSYTPVNLDYLYGYVY